MPLYLTELFKFCGRLIEERHGLEEGGYSYRLVSKLALSEAVPTTYEQLKLSDCDCSSSTVLGSSNRS